MAHRMGLSMSFMVFLTILASAVHGLHPKSPSYWKENLPNTVREGSASNNFFYNDPADAKKPLDGKGLASNPLLHTDLADAKKPSDGKGSASNIPDHANAMMHSDNHWLLLFLLEKDLQVGTKKLLYLGEGSKDEQTDFLPRHLADNIPFSSDKLSVALEQLSIPEGSAAALAMKQTIEQCEHPAIHGESRYCPTSLESMVDYSISILGTSDVNVLMTNASKNSVKQYYTFTAIPFQSKSGSRAMVCHPKVYPYAVYYCHQAKNTKAARVSLKGEDGTIVEGVAMCHGDTSEWDPNHVSFKVLNIKPGGPAVCHFIPHGHIVWNSAN